MTFREGKGGMGIPSTICSATLGVCVLSATPEWSNRFQGQEIQRAAPILLLIGEMGKYISGV